MTHTVARPPAAITMDQAVCVFVCIYYILDVSPRIFPAFPPLVVGVKKRCAFRIF
jgi:hypothetical protein